MTLRRSDGDVPRRPELAEGVHPMTTVAREIQIEATSDTSGDHAVVEGIAGACQKLGGVRYARVNETRVDRSHGSAADRKIRLLVTFVLND